MCHSRARNAGSANLTYVTCKTPRRYETRADEATRKPQPVARARVDHPNSALRHL